MEYHAHVPNLHKLISTDFMHIEGHDLNDVEQKVCKNNDIVEKVDKPDLVFVDSEYLAAELRADALKCHADDLVVTLIIQLPNTIRVESVYYMDLYDRINEVKRLSTGQAIIKLAYSEETSQVFYENDTGTDVTPRRPNYGYQQVKKIRRAVK